MTTFSNFFEYTTLIQLNSLRNYYTISTTFNHSIYKSIPVLTHYLHKDQSI